MRTTLVLGALRMALGQRRRGADVALRRRCVDSPGARSASARSPRCSTSTSSSRFYYDQLDPAALNDAHAVDVAGTAAPGSRPGRRRSAPAAHGGQGLTMDDRARAREAADLWLTFLSADGGPGAAVA
jgi:hypothetical protein